MIAGASAPRLTAVLGALLIACSPSPESPGKGMAETRPHLLLVTLDTVRADRLGSYGYAAAGTPALDALAARGTLFEQAFTPAPMTLPAHATLLTGRLPPEHGARVNGEHHLAEEIPTLAEHLAAEGYRTAAFVAASVLRAKFGLARGFETYDDDLSGAYRQEVPEPLSVYRPGDRVVDEALGWLEGVFASERVAEGGRATGSPAPFFVWVHLYDAHYPWRGHAELAEAPFAEEASYDAELAFVDRQVGRLLAWLARHRLAEQTLVVALADHGEGLGDHGEGEHGFLLNEEVLRVPWIVAGPGVVEGQRVDTLVALEDFFPTVLDLLGLAVADGLPGRSLSAALQGESLPSRPSYAETDLPWTSFRWGPQRSLTTERWKYIRTPRSELYDRETDRAELVNLARVRPETLDALEEQLAALEAALATREPAPVALSAAEREQLASLGYVTGGGREGAPEGADPLADMKDMLAVKQLVSRLRRGIATESLEPAEVLEIAEELVRRSPQTPSFHGHLGVALVDQGHAERGIAELAEAVRLNPGSASAHYDLGDVLETRGRVGEARDHFETALRIDPEFAPAHVGMGNVLSVEGQLDLAAGHYTEAIRLRPGYPEAHYNLGQNFARRGRPGLAIEHYAQALEGRPAWALAHFALAGVLREQGRLAEAIAHYEASLAAEPGDADAQNDLGVALAAAGHKEEARKHYEAALRLRPGFFRPHINLGNEAVDAGDYEAAAAHFEQALRLEPELAEPVTRLTRFLATCPDAERRDPERAVALGERAVALTQGRSASVLDTLAVAYAAAGRGPEAMVTAHRAQKRAVLHGEQALAADIRQRLARDFEIDLESGAASRGGAP